MTNPARNRDPDDVESFRLNVPGSPGPNPASSLSLQTLVAYPALYREVNECERALTDAPPDTHLSTRVFNVIVAIVGLIIAAPLFLLIAIAIKLTSRGPVFYTQTRIGLDKRWINRGSEHDSRKCDVGGRPFTMYKFRTMIVNAEQNGQEVWAAKDDPRITPVGRLLRRTRLDELPQLVNVVQGSMNVVGPRPERPSIFSDMCALIPGYALRQRVMPGITGWAQINHHYDTCVDDVRRKVDLDMEYVRRRSLKYDAQILMKTVPVVVWSELGW